MAITPSDLTSLGRWLVAQHASGLVDVRTVSQVVGGSAGPVVAGPPASSRPALLVNPSLEQEAVDETRSTGDGSPYCWERASYGTSSATWSRTSDSHSGSWAQEVTVTSMSSGDVKLMSRRDTGACSPTVTSGESYGLSAWYRSTAPARFVVYYGDDRGHWTYWTSSPEQSPSTSWTQAEWALPDLPSGATRVAFGLALATPGHLVVDDFGLSAGGGLGAATAAAGETRGRSVLVLTPVLGLLVVGAGVLAYRRRVAPASSRGRHGASVGPVGSR
jgi:hypothetical protein